MKEWLSERMNKKWVSQRAKRCLMTEYPEDGLPSQIWGFARCNQIIREMREKRIEYTDLIGEHSSFQAPEYAYEAAKKAIDSRYVKYAVYPDFNEAVAGYLKRKFKLEINPETELLATAGSNMGIMLALQALVDPGDEVLIMDPDYACYEPMARYEGAKVVPVPLRWKNGQWKFDPEELKKRATRKTKLLMITTPSNPAGIVYAKDDLEAIAELAVKNDFFVFSDELYAEHVYDGGEHLSIATFPGMMERTVTVAGFSKCHWMSGFRIGYIVANEELIMHFGNGIRWAVQRAPSVGQKVGAALLTWSGYDAWIDEQRHRLQHARDFMVRKVSEIDGVICNTPEGAVYVFPDVREPMKRSGMKSTQELTEYLLCEARASVYAGYPWGRNGEGHIRMHFGRPDEQIIEVVGRIKEAIEKL